MAPRVGGKVIVARNLTRQPKIGIRLSHDASFTVYISAGTKTYSFLDGDCTESEAAYLLAISEKVIFIMMLICCQGSVTVQWFFPANALISSCWP